MPEKGIMLITAKFILNLGWVSPDVSYWEPWRGVSGKRVLVPLWPDNPFFYNEGADEYDPDEEFQVFFPGDMTRKWTVYRSELSEEEDYSGTIDEWVREHSDG